MTSIYFFNFDILRKHCEYGREVCTGEIICVYGTPFAIIEDRICCEEICPWMKDAVKIKSSPELGDRTE